jgi:tRNA threonylcarbamoyl adenosine modification protein YeaZ
VVPLVLAFDAATDVATASLYEDGHVLAERVEAPAPRAAQGVLALADALLRAQGRTPRDLGAVVVGTGPGSYTGLRIAIAAARGLAFSLAIPLAGASTLDALRQGGDDGAYAVIDARRGEVFAAGPELEPTVLAPAALAARLPQGARCVGDGALRHRAVLAAAGAVVPPDDDPRHAPRAAALAGIAARDGFTGSSEPRYLRRPDAETAAA